MGGVSGDTGDRTCGIIDCCFSVFKYSGVGNLLKEGFCTAMASCLLDSPGSLLSLPLSFNLESLSPIKSGCFGAGLAGTGFRPVMLRGSCVGMAGNDRLGGSPCGGLAVDPLLFSNFNSENDIALSLF